jgi:acetyl-CoA carboxylase biotin carboxyl carrier protein
MIDLRYLKKLVELLDGSTVDSIEITSEKGMKLRLSKTPQQRGTVQVTSPVSLPAVIPAPVSAPRLTAADGLSAMPTEAAPAPVAAPQ